MNLKKILIWAIVFISLIVAVVIILALLRSPEDDWIKDKKGIWIKHGNPSFSPEEVISQQDAIVCAADLYSNYPKENISSQCLGKCWDYSVDFVNVPRKEIDDRVENQCEDYRTRRTHYFIELDKDGNIVRAV